MIYFLMGLGWFVTAFLAQRYRNQRDDVARAWIHLHPDDFKEEQE